MIHLVSNQKLITRNPFPNQKQKNHQYQGKIGNSWTIGSSKNNPLNLSENTLTNPNSFIKKSIKLINNCPKTSRGESNSRRKCIQKNNMKDKEWMKNSSKSITLKANRKWEKSFPKCKKNQIMLKPCSEEVKSESRKWKRKKKWKQKNKIKNTRNKRKLFHAKSKYNNC